MDRHPKNPIPLDSFSPAHERRLEDGIERARREALESYNESTFGERRPYIYSFCRLLVVMLSAFALIAVLPHELSRLAVVVVLPIYWIWEGNYRNQ